MLMLLKRPIDMEKLDHMLTSVETLRKIGMESMDKFVDGKIDAVGLLPGMIGLLIWNSHALAHLLECEKNRTSKV